MNKLPTAKRAAIVLALAEGNSIRATARLTGTAKATVLKLLVDLGEFCSIYQDHALRNLTTRRVEVDEIWAFVGAKQKNATKDGQGDIWTYTAIDADSKLMVSWLVGPRNHETTFAFMRDVAFRLANRVQLTTDGLGWYVSAVEEAFGWNGVDFAQIIKTYGTPLDETERHRRYSPAVCTGAIKTPIMGNPDAEKISTSYVERQNLNMRMQNAPVHALDERVQQEGREPRARGQPVLHVLQLLPAAHDAHQGQERHQDDARHGSGAHRSRLEGRGNSGPGGRQGTVTMKLTHYPTLSGLDAHSGAR